MQRNTSIPMSFYLIFNLMYHTVFARCAVVATEIRFDNSRRRNTTLMGNHTTSGNDELETKAYRWKLTGICKNYSIKITI